MRKMQLEEDTEGRMQLELLIVLLLIIRLLKTIHLRLETEIQWNKKE